MYCHWNGKLNNIEKYKEKYKNHTNPFYLEKSISLKASIRIRETISETTLKTILEKFQ